MSEQIAKPPELHPDHLLFLDELRASGETNMWGTGAYLRSEFPDLSKQEASQIAVYWMRTFPQRSAA